MEEWDRIIADLHDIEDVDRAVAAMRRLDRASDRSRLPALYRLLTKGRDFFVREAAAEPIIRLDGLKALPRLLHALKLGEAERHDNDGLAFSISGLVMEQAEGAAQWLRPMLRDPSDWTRGKAAWLWGFARPATEAGPLFPLMNDPSPSVRSAAVGSLGSFEGRDDVFAALVAALEDGDDQVRSSAISALGYYGDPRALPLLEALLQDRSECIRASARSGVKQLGRAS